MNRGVWCVAWLLVACGESGAIGLDGSGGSKDGGGGADRIVEEPLDAGEEFPDVPPIDAGEAPYDPNCSACRSDGQTCTFSLNCAPGSICNTPSDPLHDPSAPEGICIRVVCSSDQECAAPKTCTLEGRCAVPPCQSDDACTAPERCISGECSPPPAASAARSCRIFASNRLLGLGETAELAAIALDASGAVLPGVSHDFSAANAGIVDFSAGAMTAIGAGATTVFATVRGSMVQCSADVRVLPALAAGELRIAVADAETGGPLPGATVQFPLGLGPLTATTQENGATAIYRSSAPAWITVQASGFETLRVYQPGSDARVALRRQDGSRSAGVRGFVNLSSQRLGDVKLALAGFALPPGPLELNTALERWVSPQISTVMDAPELGLNREIVTLPEGYIFGLGNRTFTEDDPQAGERCSGLTRPGSQAFGCYVPGAPLDRPTALFALGGMWSLSQVSSIAEHLAGSESFTAGFLPFIAAGRHGVRPLLEPPSVPNRPITGMVDCNLPENFTQCQPSRELYSQEDVAIEAPTEILTEVAVPELPRLGPAACEGSVLLIAGAALPGRGVVPLGLNSGETVEAACAVRQTFEPFGEAAPMPLVGRIHLRSAALHRGMEGAPKVLMAIAFDRSDFMAGQERGLSMLLDRRRTLGTDERIEGAFLPVPRAVVHLDSRTVELTSMPLDATARGIRITSGAQVLTVIGPANLQTLSLGDQPLPPDARFEVFAIRVPDPWSELVRSGAPPVLERLLLLPSAAFALRVCGGTDCPIQ